MRSPWRWIGLAGYAVTLTAARAASDTSYTQPDSTNPPPAFSIPATGNPFAPPEQVRAPENDIIWARPEPRRARARPLGANGLPSGQVCVPEPPPRTIAMTAGSQVFNVLTRHAKPNSTITLRIDNRTTVTITVNADPVPSAACSPETPIGDLPPASPPAGPSGALPGPGPGLGSIVEGAGWWPLFPGYSAQSGNSATSGSGGTRSGPGTGDSSGGTGQSGSGDGTYQGGGNAGTQPGGQTAEIEPSTLIILGTGIAALWAFGRWRR